MKFVSWACKTYGREKHVPEIIRMFLEQDYKGKKEFVLLNDDPDVKYVFDHPEVRIYNWNYRFSNMRVKNNMCVRLCNGEVYMPIADDDLFKPHATTTFMDAIGDCPFVAARGFWKKDLTKVGMHATVWHDVTIGGLFACRVDFFKRMGGYAIWMWFPFGDKIRDDRVQEWILHPENFMERVRETDGCYKEFKVEQRDGFFTWVRGTDHYWHVGHHNDPDKYFIKKRNPTIIEVKL